MYLSNHIFVKMEFPMEEIFDSTPGRTRAWKIKSSSFFTSGNSLQRTPGC